MRDPKGEKIFTKSFTADAYGGFDGSSNCRRTPRSASTRSSIANRGGGTFRVEEYKKPEFEVNVKAPDRPVMLGEKVAATIKAKYYFGAPGRQGEVKYKVIRATANADWYPAGRWDWLSARATGGSPPITSWYPGWRGGAASGRWPGGGASRRPARNGRRGRGADRPDGTVTSRSTPRWPGRLHPDQDQRYEITAEVTDQSRRTIVGTGTVLVARKPFSLHLGRSRPLPYGDTIEAVPRSNAGSQAGGRQGNVPAASGQLRPRR